MKALCNEGCNQEFELGELDVLPIRDDIERVCFTCPHCEKDYTVNYTNGIIKKLQEEQRKLLQKSMIPNLTLGQLKGIMTRIDNKKLKIKNEMDRLRKEIETD